MTWVTSQWAADIEHRDGVPWHEAPVPRLGHRHNAQSRGYVGTLSLVERCACGAFRRDHGPWFGMKWWTARERWPWEKRP